MTSDPSDADTVLSALDFDVNWLLELSNANPAQFVGREERLYSIMNRIQLVALVGALSHASHVARERKGLGRRFGCTARRPPAY